MAKKKVARLRPDPHFDRLARTFFMNAFGGVDDPEEIIEGLQDLVFCMGDQQAAHENTPPHIIRLWRDQLSVLQARVECLALDRSTVSQGEVA